MGVTPDRFPGPTVEDEEVLLSEQITGATPTAAGAFLYVDGAFKFRDGLGNFDPRDGIAGIAIPTLLDKRLVCLVTDSDFDKATNSTISATPAFGSYVQVMVNGVQADLGDGVKTKDCYFSGDAGTTARAIEDVVAGDTIHWVGSVAGFELDADDRLDFNYVAVGAGSQIVAVEVVEASQPSALLANGVRYVPLVKGETDWVQFQFLVPAFVSTVTLHVHYHMSAANAGDVELHLDTLAVSPTDDPTAALVGGDEFVVTPGNDVLMHVISDGDDASLAIDVMPGDLLICKLQRTADTQDTHTGDVRITGIWAEV